LLNVGVAGRAVCTRFIFEKRLGDDGNERRVRGKQQPRLELLELEIGRGMRGGGVRFTGSMHGGSRRVGRLCVHSIPDPAKQLLSFW
jgi:hypothetical protein